MLCILTLDIIGISEKVLSMGFYVEESNYDDTNDADDYDQGHPTRFPGKYLLLNQLIPGWLAKLNNSKF